MTVYERNFSRLVRLGIISPEGELRFKEAIKLKSRGFMDLNIDLIGHTDDKGSYKIAMAHNYEQNGDIMADPDMEINIIPLMHSIEALTYQQDSLRIYQKVYPEPGKIDLQAKKELNSFLETWLKNLIAQGFKYSGE